MGFSSNDLIFNNKNFKELLKVEKIEMSLLPQIENISQKIPGRAGNLFRKNQLGSREIVIYCRLIKKSREDIFNARRELASLLYTQKPEVLKFRNEKNLYYKAILDGDTKFEIKGKSAFIVLKFIAHDPLGYSEDRVISATGTRIEFEYNASYESAPIITARLKSTNPEFILIDSISKDFVKIKNNFNSGNMVKIDCINNFVEINSYKSMKLLDYNSDFLKIRKGRNIWTFSSPVDYEVRYSERWL